MTIVVIHHVQITIRRGGGEITGSLLSACAAPERIKGS